MTDAVRLSAAVRDACAAVAPIDGVLMGNAADRSTWRCVFQASATAQQRAAAQSAINGFDLSAVDAASAAETQRRADLRADAGRSDLAARIASATPAQIDTWLTNNVTNLVQARAVLAAIIKYIVALD